MEIEIKTDRKRERESRSQGSREDSDDWQIENERW